MQTALGAVGVVRRCHAARGPIKKLPSAALVGARRFHKLAVRQSNQHRVVAAKVVADNRFLGFSASRRFSSAANSSAPLLSGLTIVKGDPVNMKADLGKKVFVVEFWATWCPPCRASIPHLTQLAHKYSSQGAQFIGITDEDRSKVDRFVAQMGPKMDYTVAIDTDGSSQEYMQRYNIQGIPHAFIVNRKGKISWHGHPMDPGFETNLSAALAETPSPSNTTSDVTEEKVRKMSAQELKSFLQSRSVNTSDCLEKADLLTKALLLVKK